MITTPWKPIGDRRRMRVEYGMQKLGQQEPYFSITAEIHRQAGNNRWTEDSCGCLHEYIEKHYPELAPLVKWHLVFRDSGPMHYEANGVFWWAVATGRVKQERSHEDPFACFASVIVLGYVLGIGEKTPHMDDGTLVIGAHRLASSDDVLAFLRARLPGLMAAFRDAMAAAGVFSWRKVRATGREGQAVERKVSAEDAEHARTVFAAEVEETHTILSVEPA